MYCVLDFPLYLTRIIAVILCLITAYVSGVVQFTEEPRDIHAIVGDTVNIVWNYTVTNRINEFTGYSPIWSYSSDIIASEDKFDSWKWKIVNGTCPKRFLLPKRRIFKKDVATLVITNVILEDIGTYWCELGIKIGTNPKSSMNLFVVSPTTVPPTTQPTNTTDNSSSTATPTPPTGTNSTTTPKPQKDGPNLAVIFGGLFGGLACCGACAGGGYCCYKKSKKSSDQNCANSGVELKTKEGNDNQTPPSA